MQWQETIDKVWSNLLVFIWINRSYLSICFVKHTHTHYDHVFSHPKAKGITMSSHRINNVVRTHLVISSGVDLLRWPLKCLPSQFVVWGQAEATEHWVEKQLQSQPPGWFSVRLDNGAASVVFRSWVALLLLKWTVDRKQDSLTLTLLNILH